MTTADKLLLPAYMAVTIVATALGMLAFAEYGGPGVHDTTAPVVLLLPAIGAPNESRSELRPTFAD